MARLYGERVGMTQWWVPKDSVWDLRMEETPEGLVITEILDESLVYGGLRVGLILLSIAEKDMVGMSCKELAMMLDKSKREVEIVTCRSNEHSLPQEKVVNDSMLGDVSANTAAEAKGIVKDEAAVLKLRD